VSAKINASSASPKSSSTFISRFINVDWRARAPASAPASARSIGNSSFYVRSKFISRRARMNENASDPEVLPGCRWNRCRGIARYRYRAVTKRSFNVAYLD
jgi:hypothetical protein